jgi:hypothetical protein
MAPVKAINRGAPPVVGSVPVVVVTVVSVVVSSAGMPVPSVGRIAAAGAAAAAPPAAAPGAPALLDPPELPEPGLPELELELLLAGGGGLELEELLDPSCAMAMPVQSNAHPATIKRAVLLIMVFSWKCLLKMMSFELRVVCQRWRCCAKGMKIGLPHSSYIHPRCALASDARCAPDAKNGQLKEDS